MSLISSAPTTLGLVTAALATCVAPLGAGDAYNEKLKAEAIATQSRCEALENRFAQQAEVGKALSDRGRVPRLSHNDNRSAT